MSTISVEERKDTFKYYQQTSKFGRTGNPKMSIARPYATLKEAFLEDRCVTSQQMLKEILIAMIPHMLLVFLLMMYVVFGGFLFRLIEPDVRNRSFGESVLFVFTTITTIGYGDISPVSFEGKIACIIYCVVGIPLIFLVFSNSGQFVNDIWRVYSRSTSKSQISDLPLWFSCLLLLLHSLLGGFIFSQWLGEMSFISAAYFSFISIATIGYGDILPPVNDEFHIVVIITYLSTGIVILSTLLGSLSVWLKWIHNIGRPACDSTETVVWIGGDSITVKDLVNIVADKFKVDPHRLQSVLHDLDDILSVACSEENESRLLNETATSVRKETFVVKLEKEEHSCLLLGENDQYREKVASNVSLQQSISGEPEQALRALSVIHHKLKKQGSVKKNNRKLSYYNI